MSLLRLFEISWSTFLVFSPVITKKRAYKNCYCN